MQATGKTPVRLLIGDLELDEGTFSLKREGEQIELPPLSFELLLCLARHAPNVVTTETLMDEVWGQVIVGEETVKQRVKLLRKALGDSSEDPRYVAAVRGRGYRLLADVSPLTDDAEVAPFERRGRRSVRTWLLPVVLLAVIAVGYFLVTHETAPETPLAGTGQEDPGHKGTDSPEAWEAYRKGRAAYRRWTRHDNETALAFYQRAAALDPDFALAIAGAANANALRATEFGLGEEWIDEAIGLARRALELEPELPEALKALGICHVFTGHYQTALDYYRSALRIDPHYDEVIFNAAELLHRLGRWDEAVEFQQRDSSRSQGLLQLSIYLRDLGFDERAAALAQQVAHDLPVSFFMDANLSLHYVLNRDFEAAHAAARRMQRAVPGAADGWLREGEIHLFAGDPVSAAEEFQAARQVAGEHDDYATLRVAQMQILEGDTAAAETLLKQVEASALQAIGSGHEGWPHRWHLAFLHSVAGNLDEALGWFEQAVDAGRRRFEWDESEPAFLPLRGEPRFEAALQRQRDLRQEMKRNAAAIDALPES